MYRPLSWKAYGSSQMPLNVNRFRCTPASYHCAVRAGCSVIGTSHTKLPAGLIVKTYWQPGAIGSRCHARSAEIEYVADACHRFAIRLVNDICSVW